MFQASQPSLRLMRRVLVFRKSSPSHSVTINARLQMLGDRQFWVTQDSQTTHGSYNPPYEIADSEQQPNLRSTRVLHAPRVLVWERDALD